MSNERRIVEVPRPSGLELRSMRALRFTGAAGPLADLLAPPYDVIDTDLRIELLGRCEHNVVALTLPAADGHGSEYDAAAALLEQWRENDLLAADSTPGLYVYEQASGGHAQRGLLGAVALTPAEDGIVLPHENTMAGPVADRLALSRATQANLEPIFLVYDGGGAATAAVAGADEEPPLVDVEDPQGVRHRLWSITDAATLDEIAADLAPRRAVIADGHHRYATYLAQQRAERESGRGSGPWDAGLTFLVDAGSFGPEVHAIHRVIPGLDPARAVELAGTAFTVTPSTEAEAVTALNVAAGGEPVFALSDGERVWLLRDPDPDRLDTALPRDRSAAWRALHVNVAHHLLFSALWGLEDREGVVDFVHDVAAALDSARRTGGTAVLLAATPVSAVTAVAAAGDRMPRKSTLFMPKPATGMVMRVFADQP